MRTAEQIKDEMREAVEEHNTRAAQDAALQAAIELGSVSDGLLNRVRFSCRSLRREDVQALLEQLAPYLALLAEVAPTLPAKEAPVAEEKAA